MVMRSARGRDPNALATCARAYLVVGRTEHHFCGAFLAGGRERTCVVAVHPFALDALLYQGLAFVFAADLTRCTFFAGTDDDIFLLATTRQKKQHAAAYECEYRTRAPHTLAGFACCGLRNHGDPLCDASRVFLTNVMGIEGGRQLSCVVRADQSAPCDKNFIRIGASGVDVHAMRCRQYCGT